VAYKNYVDSFVDCLKSDNDVVKLAAAEFVQTLEAAPLESLKNVRPRSLPQLVDKWRALCKTIEITLGFVVAEQMVMQELLLLCRRRSALPPVHRKYVPGSATPLQPLPAESVQRYEVQVAFATATVLCWTQ
jgi:hypothetical protein